MFSKLRVQGLRGIPKLEINGLKRINLFVGKNNSGKTTILESIFLLIGATNPQLPLRINLFRGGFNVSDDNSLRVLFNKLIVNTDILLSGELKNPSERRILKIKPHLQSTLSTNSTKSKMDQFFDLEDSYAGTTSVIDGLVMEFSLLRGKAQKAEEFVSKIIVKEINTEKGAERVLDSHPPQKYKEQLKGVFLNSRTIFYGGDLATRFNTIQIKKQTSAIVNVLKDIEPSLVSLTLGKDGVVYCDIGLDKLVPINVMGDGMFRLLFIIVSIFDSQNGVVLIDEIENGFHYLSQENLWNSILRASEEFNVQVFATTHSMECVKAFSSVSSRNSKHDTVRLFRLEKKAENIRLVSYDNKTLSSSIESDWEVR